jgi:hypothetical protein
LALALGCHGDKESLVVVALTANPATSGVTMLTLSVGGVSKTLAPTSGGLSNVPVKYGVYVSGGVAPGVVVMAQAMGACAYSGSGATTNTTAAAAGSTVNAAVELHPTNCTDAGVTGDAAATGGSAGGGSGGAGTGGGGGGAATGGAATGGAATGGAGTAGIGVAGMSTGGAVAGGRGGGGQGTGGAGAAGSTASGGVGAGGMGTGGASVNPPTLSGCIEYDHDVASQVPCVEGGNGDWAVRSVAISPDGKTVVSAGEDGRIKIWKFDGNALTAEGHTFALPRQSYVAFSPDGTLLAAGSRSTIAIWNVATWAARPNLTGVTGDIGALAFTPNGQSIISIDSDDKLYMHGLTGAPLTTLGPLAASPVSLATSPSTVTTGVFVVVGSTSGDVSTYSIGASAINPTPTATLHVVTDPFDTRIGALQFSPDGKLLAVGTADAVVHFWSFPFANMAASSGANLVLDADGSNGYESVNGVAFSSNGLYLAVATGGYNSGGAGSIWDVRARGQLGGISAGLKYYMLSVAFAPSGGAIVLGEAACGKVGLCAN